MLPMTDLASYAAPASENMVFLAPDTCHAAVVELESRQISEADSGGLRAEAFRQAVRHGPQVKLGR